jgi:hypothetical protein
MSTVTAGPSTSQEKRIGLMFASTAIGGLAGGVGYLIAGYFYALFLFPFILLAVAGIFYIPALRFLGSSGKTINSLCGLVMGLALFSGFHYTEYLVFRSDITGRIQAAASLDEASASRSLDAYLTEKTGLGGFLGFMNYQQSQWRPYVYYFVKDGEISSSQDLVLQGTKAWLYLAGEAAVLISGGGLLGFLGTSRFPSEGKRQKAEPN